MPIFQSTLGVILRFLPLLPEAIFEVIEFDKN